MSTVKYVPGEGYSTSKIIFIGEAPGAEEEKAGIPFVGRSGVLLRNCLMEAGIMPEHVYFTNAVKVRPPGNRRPTKEEVKSWANILEAEIENIRKDHVRLEIFPLGKTAQLAISMTKFMATDHLKHPSYVLRGFYKRQKYINDFKKLRKYL